MTPFYQYAIGFGLGVSTTCLTIILAGRWPWNRELYLRSHDRRVTPERGS